MKESQLADLGVEVERAFQPQRKPGVFVVRRYRVLLADRTCQAITGYGSDELLNRDVRQLLHADFRHAARLALLSTGGNAPRTQAYEVKIVAKSGEERWIAGELVRIAADGEPAVLGTVFDITPGKRAEEFARSGVGALGQVFDEAPLGMALVGPDLRLLRVNRALCRMLGYEVSEMVGRRTTDFVHPAYAAASFAAGQALIEGKTDRVSAERRYVRKDGSELWVGITAGPLRDSKGEVVCGLLMVEDITHRKRAESEERRYAQNLLSAIEEERSRVARDLHDEIGQSLAFVCMQLRALVRRAGDGAGPGDGLREAASRVEETARAVAALAHQYHPADLRSLGLCAALRAFVSQWVRDRGIEVETAIEQVGGILSGEQELHVYRIVQEALNNVAKHARATRASVTVATRGASIVVTVEDNGVGFDLASASAGCKGLGLSTMRERARMAGGEISFRRGASGGCRVSLVIPVR